MTNPNTLRERALACHALHVPGRPLVLPNARIDRFLRAAGGWTPLWNGPLTVLVGPGAPPVAELAALAVARVSAGSGLAEAAHAAVRRAARELLDAGTYRARASGLDHGELNTLPARERWGQQASRISSARSWSRSSWRCSRPVGTRSPVASRNRRISPVRTWMTAVPSGAWNSSTVRS